MKPLNTLLCVVVVTLSAITGSAQSPSFPEGVSKKYDRFRDSTTVTFRLRLQGTEFDGLMLEASYAYRGQSSVSKSPLSVSLVALSPILKTDYYPTRQETLILLLDGRRETFELFIGTNAVAGLRMKIMSSSEFKDFLMPISRAQKVEGKVSVIEFQIKPKQQEMLRDFLVTYGPQFEIKEY